MPKQKRWTIKRNLFQAIGNLDTAIDNLARAGHEFEVIHPQHYTAFCMIAQNIKLIKESILDLEGQI